MSHAYLWSYILVSFHSKYTKTTNLQTNLHVHVSSDVIPLLWEKEDNDRKLGLSLLIN